MVVCSRVTEERMNEQVRAGHWVRERESASSSPYNQELFQSNNQLPKVLQAFDVSTPPLDWQAVGSLPLHPHSNLVL